MATSALVLAGGAASRFGGDKLAVEVRGRPVLHHALLAADAVADRVVVVLGPAGLVPGWPDGLRSLPGVARDPRPHGGPLAGIATGLEALAREARAGEADRVLVVAGDMPSLVPGVLRALLDALDGDAALAAAWLEARPFAPLPMAVRPARVAVAVGAALAGGRRSLRSMLEAVPSGPVPSTAWRALDPAGLSLRDIDTRADLEGA
jgi:molybdopterin-guanine dinucleotide biosynthesis protein A